jgi:hypothetical protein
MSCASAVVDEEARCPSHAARLLIFCHWIYFSWFLFTNIHFREILNSPPSSVGKESDFGRQIAGSMPCFVELFQEKKPQTSQMRMVNQVAPLRPTRMRWRFKHT